MLSLELKCSGWRMRKQAFLPFCQMDQYYRKCRESETLWCGSESGSLFHFDTNPDPTFPFDPDPDPAPYQICHHWYIDLPRLQFWNSMTQLWASMALHISFLSLHTHNSCILTLMRIRIRLLTLMRSGSGFKMIQIHADLSADPVLDPQNWLLKRLSLWFSNSTSSFYHLLYTDI